MIGLKKRKEVVEDDDNTSVTKSLGYLHIQKELPELPSLIIPQAKLYLDKSNPMSFKVDYTPDKESFWYPGVYNFTFTIPNEYNSKPPKVMCNTKIYHPNIDLQGNVCLNILKEGDWRPTLDIATVIASVYFLFYDPNPKDPLNHDAAELMRDDMSTFQANIRKTLKGGKHFGEEFPKFV